MSVPIPDSGQQRRGDLFALAAAMGTALATVIGKWTLTHMSPTAMNAGIFTMAALIFTLRGTATWRSHPPALSRRGLLLVCLFTCISMGGIWLFWSGLRIMDPSLAAFLNRSEVFVSVALAVLFLGERYSGKEALGAVISIGGVVVMRMTLRLEFAEGFWLVLGGAALAGTSEFVAKQVVREGSIQAIMWIRSLLMAAGFWTALTVRGEALTGLHMAWPGVVALGVIGPVLAREAYMHALKRIPLSRAAVIAQTYPVFVLILAMATLGQSPSMRELAGGILIVGGCVVMSVSRPRQSG